MSEPVSTMPRLYDPACALGGRAQGGTGTGRDGADPLFDQAPSGLDGVEVGRVGGQKADRSPSLFDQRPHRACLVRRQVVQDSRYRGPSPDWPRIRRERPDGAGLSGGPSVGTPDGQPGPSHDLVPLAATVFFEHVPRPLQRPQDAGSMDPARRAHPPSVCAGPPHSTLRVVAMSRLSAQTANESLSQAIVPSPQKSSQQCPKNVAQGDFLTFP